MAMSSLHRLMTSTSPIHDLSFLSSGFTFPTISRIIAYMVFKMNMFYTCFSTPDSATHSIKFSINELTVNLASKLEILIFSSAPSFSHMISNQLDIIISNLIINSCQLYLPTFSESSSTLRLYPNSHSCLD